MFYRTILNKTEVQLVKKTKIIRVWWAINSICPESLAPSPDLFLPTWRDEQSEAFGNSSELKRPTLNSGN